MDSLWHFAEAWKILKVKVKNPNINQTFQCDRQPSQVTVTD